MEKISNYALTFAGQATPWQETLRSVTLNPQVAGALQKLVTAGHAHLATLGRELAVIAGSFTTLQSLLDASPENPAASLPGILLAQYGVLLDLEAEGVDLCHPVATAGHSQGVLGVALFEAWQNDDWEQMGSIYALAEIMGACATSTTRTQHARPVDAVTPMLAVLYATENQVKEVIAAADLSQRVHVALINGPGQVVVSGTPADLVVFEREAQIVAEHEQQEIAAKRRGGRPFDPRFQYLSVGAPFHSSVLAEALEQTQKFSAKVGLDQDLVDSLAPRVLTEPVNWGEQLANLVEAGAVWVLNVGPGSALDTLNTTILQGSGVGTIDLATNEDRDDFIAAGVKDTDVTDWSAWLPRVTTLSNGTKALSTAFTRLTGRSPVLLAGMTPTTVDPEIVAAAANAGYWAELAGGGQVTEAVFASNLAKLKDLLNPGRAAQFNAMFLDPYLWNLQFGTQSIVTKARAAGAPLDGVVVSAGIPELDEAVQLIADLNNAGFPYIAFKPGTVAQIRQVVQIAAAAPSFPVIIQVEDGHAGGHHSWENLDDLLLATYPDIRETKNLVLCVGGGIGTPQRCADYISGEWSLGYGRPLMPVDGVLIGTAAMTALEAKTSPQVKQLLVETSGVANPPLDELDGWVPAGGVRGGVTSGQSHLRADIHEINNAAAACARLISEVSGDAEAVASRREELIAALDSSAKPYFGDVDQMTYLQWAQRFADLCVSPLDGTWNDDTWTVRFQLLLQRIEGRMSPEESGKIPTLYPTSEDVVNAEAALSRLENAYPHVESTRVSPTDAAWFVDLCRRFPKPMPFVPVLDADLLRWWGQDNLWQSQDPRYSADEVRIIPGPVAVAGITTIDEPISKLLSRFEEAALLRVSEGGQATEDLYARLGNASSKEAFIRDVPFISWSGNLVDNPARVVDGGQLEITDQADLVITLDTAWDSLSEGSRPHAVGTLTVPLTVDEDCETGGYPVVDRARLPKEMFNLLQATAGVGGETITGDPIKNLPKMVPSDDSQFGEAHWEFTVTPALADLHRGATAEGLPAKYHLAQWVPDALLGQCWPAIYAALGSAMLEDGFPVIEGLLSAVHLDHTASLDVDLEELLAKDESLKVLVVARTISMAESSAGRIVTVLETLLHDGQEIGFFQERFAIRGRIGSDALPVSVAPAAGKALGVVDTPRSLMRRAQVTAPSDMTVFANVSGDFNPIHTSTAAARVAGLNDALVHGMWLSAVAQNLVEASDGKERGMRITGWTYNMYGLVNLEDKVDISVERVGRILGGGLLLEVTCKVDGQIVSQASAATAAPTTAYIYPGQGIQSQGMALDEMKTSAAAREVWERADRLTRDVLGFSILTLVRDNPTEIRLNGQVLRHPDGVLNLTQFTQVALATVAFAQTARLREMGALVEGAYFAGHSLGEYNALSAYGEIFGLESVLEIVFHRGSTMHHLVERDEQGHSDYRMGALRPNQFGVGDDQVQDYVESVATQSGEFLQIVNFNLAGQQYAVAGTVAGLAALEADANSRAKAAGGKRPFMYVPGVDVPFHSSVLRPGVAEFRDRLETLIPVNIPAKRLIGKYIPNLVAIPFEVSPNFAQAILKEVPSEPIEALLSKEIDWDENRDAIARLLLIELLCWQFASPVRWIETQELLLGLPENGGLGVERLVEVGLGSAPTLAGLGEKTLQLDQFASGVVQVLNVQRDEAVVTCVDVTFPETETEAATETEAEAGVLAGVADVDTVEVKLTEAPVQAASAASQAAAKSAGKPAGSNAAVADIDFHAADAIKVLIAYQNKLRLDQIEDQDTTDTLTAGVSARRNQLLMDLSAELGLPSIDGAADASVAELSLSVNRLAPHYQPFGQVLTEAVRERLRKVFGAAGLTPGFVKERLENVWQLGAGWTAATTGAILLGTRDGDSARGGKLGELPQSGANKTEAESIVDGAVEIVASQRGVNVTIPTSSADATMVDSAALEAYSTKMTEALADSATHLLAALGLKASPKPGMPAADDRDAWIAQTVEAELGPRWVEMVQPRFDAAKAVLLDDRWASAREDLARAAENMRPDPESFVGLGETISQHANWWASNVDDQELAEYYRQVSAQALKEADLPFAGQVAVVTGMTPTSIAGSIAGQLLQGGATVIATASNINQSRLSFAKDLYRCNARGEAALWLVPANLSSYRDVDALVQWIGTKQESTSGGVTKVEKTAMIPDLFFPFAAPSVSGSLSQSGEQFEAQTRLLLWSIEKSIAGLAGLAERNADNRRLHVVLPGSPNRGIFGGDGAYGETKAAFDALVNRWNTEPWAQGATLAHPLIGWVQGTGLMGANDVLIPEAKKAGVHIYTTDEITAELLALCTKEAREQAQEAPLRVDLSGGLESGFDFRALQANLSQAETEVVVEEKEEIRALPNPTQTKLADFDASLWGESQANLEDMVVVVGTGEVGPWGSARTRWQAELGMQSNGEVDLTPAGVLELAWMTGLLTWEDSPVSGWYDTEGNLVEPSDVYERFRDELVARSGIRSFITDAGIIEGGSEEDTAVFLNTDVTFTVPDQDTARSYVLADERMTRVKQLDSGEWEVTRLAGATARLPRRATLTRTVGGQFPTGFDPAKWGLSPALIEGMDRIAAWNLVSAVDAFISSGFSPAELLQAVHPADVASTQGTGFGGMTSMRQLFVDRFLGEDYPADILQETLPNVVAAHTMQTFIGGYGPMVQPVSACATAAVSVEDGIDKIRAGKAKFVVAGATDDLSIESVVGFGSMNATANSEQMAAKGIDERFYSRANDRRRGGFIESQGGGTVLLARADLAAELGLPVLAVLAYAQSFADGINTSIPAPGLGALAAARGGTDSRLARSLAELNIGADDIAFISKHDTSTGANDPNESDLHTRVAQALGRTPGNPMFVVSQKSVTGHAKGGACVFQISGVAQIFRDQKLPGNIALDCVDEALTDNPWLVWLRSPMNIETPKAALITSLGFGHVSALLALAHPGAFEAALLTQKGATLHEGWRSRAQHRLEEGARDLESGMLGRSALFSASSTRRLPNGSKEVEAAMLLDPNARLGANGEYSQG